MEKKWYVEIRLRTMESEDLDMLYHTENDRSLWNINTANVPYSRYTLHNYIADAKNNTYADEQLYVTVGNHEQEIADVVDLVNFGPRHRRAEMGIIIMEPFRQKGYAQAATSALVGYARNGLHLRQIYTVVGVDNEVLIRCLSSIGLTNDSILKEWFYCGGRYKGARVAQLFI